VGIGRPDTGEGDDVAKEDAIIAYVLSDFTPEEKKTIDTVMPVVSEAIVSLLAEGLTAAMNKYN